MQLKYIPNLPISEAERIEAEMRAANQAMAWVWQDGGRWDWSPLNIDTKGSLYIGSIGGEGCLT